MTTIPVEICIMSRNKFKRHYLNKKKRFEDFLLYFWNVHEMKNVLNQKMSILASLFPKLLNPKEVVT